MRARLAIAVALGVVAIASTHAGAQQMYRWVDKDGRVHYTQNPPPRNAAKSVEQRRLNPGGPPEGSQQVPFAVRQAMSNFPVTLYTSPDCPRGCNEARDLLLKRGVPYREISVADEASRDGLKKATGDTRVPVMMVGRNLESGFEETAFNNALDSAGYPRTSLFVGKPPVIASPKPKPPAPAASADAAPGAPAEQAAAPDAPQANPGQ